MEYVFGGLAVVIVGVIVVGVVLDRRRRGDRSPTAPGASGAEALQTKRAQTEAETRALGHGGTQQPPMGS